MTAAAPAPTAAPLPRASGGPLGAAHAQSPPVPDLPGPVAVPSVVSGSGLTWLLGGVALLSTVGWVVERRQRRLLELEKDSVFWADRQPGSNSIITTPGNLDDILPDSPDPAEAARAIYVTAIGERRARG